MIVITHARIVVNDSIPSFGVELKIEVLREKLEVARQIVKEHFQGERVYLTYTERV